MNRGDGSQMSMPGGWPVEENDVVMELDIKKKDFREDSRVGSSYEGEESPERLTSDRNQAFE